jgi:hypothetical protein
VLSGVTSIFDFDDDVKDARPRALLFFLGCPASPFLQAFCPLSLDETIKQPASVRFHLGEGYSFKVGTLSYFTTLRVETIQGILDQQFLSFDGIRKRGQEWDVQASVNSAVRSTKSRMCDLGLCVNRLHPLFFMTSATISLDIINKLAGLAKARHRLHSVPMNVYGPTLISRRHVRLSLPPAVRHNSHERCRIEVSPEPGSRRPVNKSRLPKRELSISPRSQAPGLDRALV